MANQEFGFRYVKFETPMRPPSGDEIFEPRVKGEGPGWKLI